MLFSKSTCPLKATGNIIKETHNTFAAYETASAIIILESMRFFNTTLVKFTYCSYFGKNKPYSRSHIKKIDRAPFIHKKRLSTKDKSEPPIPTLGPPDSVNTNKEKLPGKKLEFLCHKPRIAITRGQIRNSLAYKLKIASCSFQLCTNCSNYIPFRTICIPICYYLSPR